MLVPMLPYYHKMLRMRVAPHHHIIHSERLTFQIYLMFPFNEVICLTHFSTINTKISALLFSQFPLEFTTTRASVCHGFFIEIDVSLHLPCEKPWQKYIRRKTKWSIRCEWYGPIKIEWFCVYVSHRHRARTNNKKMKEKHATNERTSPLLTIVACPPELTKLKVGNSVRRRKKKNNSTK